ncbi:HD-GYP domain, c-di-GMP phosphodiesterase class II (or its inactivated variant) [Clostridium acidisoli DSM 12555]|uniref:HD-GYP domain, c-di-GMP phosphodiesterase class II (Or its inactivated variant) n=1 Tax=Clostridium acidisoli DSM 12555 TaxID=1121291 RepID=A0A1W1XV32_9CLOT|nr:HD-GYP domain-containing protein [Clostridium acidisoli]SMC27388.1 HD-GYP domain, c-di-GMP phosphodiesterase class II (or its inactivated variant) [Clostridium acidisoli DSM 12555]
MKTKKRNVAINDLEAGMIAVKNIMYDNKVLIAEGIPITEMAISKLKERYLYNKIEVYAEPNADELKEEEMERVEESFNELTGDLQKIFNGMDNLQVSGIEEVRNFAIKVKSEMDPANLIIKNIVLHGSGMDTVYRHGVNVSALSLILGKWIGLNEVQLNLLVYSAILHDFGKTKINNKVLCKEGKLTQNELKDIKSHPLVAYNYISKIPFLDKTVSQGVLLHHEREDGSGYPLGIKGEKIPTFAKIIAIADVFDAINSRRPYREKRKPFEALAIIQKEELGKLDYEYCKLFTNHIVNFYIGEKALLNDGRVCKIIKVDPDNLNAPLLFDENEFIDLKVRKDLYVEELLI